ncbi:three-helix bundle dimerization domain-containing protein [Streptomyces sp. NPDC058746]|uniref:three-helix bundle dimerization domain-containing protein n=1 Tax=Streptomyces sp. NPDC058746 TaxID=3346622 RepID=UPI00367996AB
MEHGIGAAMTVEEQTHGAGLCLPPEGVADPSVPVERADAEAPPSPAPPGSYEESVTLRDLVERLCAAFPAVDAATVEATVRSAYDSFRLARIRAYIPILVERRSRRALGAAGRDAPARAGDDGAAPVPAVITSQQTGTDR